MVYEKDAAAVAVVALVTVGVGVAAAAVGRAEQPRKVEYRCYAAGSKFQQQHCQLLDLDSYSQESYYSGESAGVVAAG